MFLCNQKRNTVVVHKKGFCWQITESLICKAIINNYIQHFFRKIFVYFKKHQYWFITTKLCCGYKFLITFFNNYFTQLQYWISSTQNIWFTDCLIVTTNAWASLTVLWISFDWFVKNSWFIRDIFSKKWKRLTLCSLFYAGECLPDNEISDKNTYRHI